MIWSWKAGLAVRLRRWLPIFAVFSLLGAFSVLTSEIHESLGGQPEMIAEVDQAISNGILELRNAHLSEIATDITALGSGSVLTIVSLGICAYLISHRQFFSLVQFLSTVIGSGLLTHLMKSYFERSRPAAVMRLVEVQGYSYPSGHSLSSASVYVAAAFLFSSRSTSFRTRLMLWIGTSGLVLMIGATRIYLGVHYFSDVTAGILLGTAWAVLLELIVSSVNQFRRIT